MFNNVVRSMYYLSVLYRIYFMRSVVEMLIQHKLMPSVLKSFQAYLSCNIFHITRGHNSVYVLLCALPELKSLNEKDTEKF